MAAVHGTSGTMGPQIPGYVLLEILGEGGMGRVYLAGRRGPEAGCVRQGPVDRERK